MPDGAPPTDPDELLPLKPQDLQVLLTLAQGPLHAYGIAKAVDEEERGTVRLEIGSLYRMLARLLTAGLIDEVEEPELAGSTDPGAPRARRRTYRITDFGRRVARAEARRLRAVVEMARERRILTDAPGG